MLLVHIGITSLRPFQMFIAVGKKTLVRVGPLLSKLSGSVHVCNDVGFAQDLQSQINEMLTWRLPGCNSMLLSHFRVFQC